jgi:hypothetical protein
VGSSGADVDALLLALEDVLTGGERWTYALDAGRWVPSPDPRRVDLALAGVLPQVTGGSSPCQE